MTERTWGQAISSSTTSSRKLGRPRGQPKAERRLKRELASRQLQSSVVTGLFNTLAELVRTAKSSPVTGLALGVAIVDLLYRARAISYTAAGAFYALFCVSAASEVIRSITAAFPFSSDAEQRNAAQPTASALTETGSVAVPPAQAEKKVVSPEFL